MVVVHYRWYDDKHIERDLVIPCEEMGAEVIRQTPMRGLNTGMGWMKILHVKAREEHLDKLYKYLNKPDETMIITPYDSEVHLAPTKVYR